VEYQVGENATRNLMAAHVLFSKTIIYKSIYSAMSFLFPTPQSSSNDRVIVCSNTIIRLIEEEVKLSYQNLQFTPPLNSDDDDWSVLTPKDMEEEEEEEEEEETEEDGIFVDASENDKEEARIQEGICALSNTQDEHASRFNTVCEADDPETPNTSANIQQHPDIIAMKWYCELLRSKTVRETDSIAAALSQKMSPPSSNFS
jgi:hypothetical protein